MIAALCAAIVLVALAMLLREAVRRGGGDWLGIPVIVAIVVVLGYVGPAYDVLQQTDLFFLRYPSGVHSLRDSMTEALAVALLATVAFAAGWYTHRPAAPPLPYRIRWRTSALRLFGVVYTVTGLSLFAIGVAVLGGPSVLIGGLGDRIRVTQGLNYLLQATVLLVVVSLVWYCRLLTTGRSTRSTAFRLYTVFAFGVSALQGSKSILFIFLLALAVLHDRLHRRIRGTLVAAGGAITFVALTAYALFAREFLALGRLVTLQTFDVASMLNVLRVEFFGNFIQLQTMMVLVGRVPHDLPFQWGRTFLATITMVVPRGLWPGKPLPSTGVFTLAFWPDSWLEFGTTLPPGLFGEFYLNYGWIGVAVGAFLFARLGRTLLARQAAAPRDPKRALVYALFVAMAAHYVRGDFAVTVALLELLLPTLVLLQFCTRREPLAPSDASLGPSRQPDA
jgi:oligosaccharide repeat unit polymerase